ncbi:TrmO family methyltransferase, partial [Kitasatospora sp. NPDC059722]|uniref:TrmO family methyltransferase domain-containing protein n=1 Tax=Kitasatospora sp. NPDC059722 TaxID=3346925 RepID=UPI003680A034
MADGHFEVRAIGRVESPLLDRSGAPRQGDEGGPEAWLAFDPAVERALADLAAGQEVLLLTWLDRADREVLAVRPRGERSRPETGVFATRSPDRPNPIGLHRVTILAGGARGGRGGGGGSGAGAPRRGGRTPPGP